MTSLTLPPRSCRLIFDSRDCDAFIHPRPFGQGLATPDPDPFAPEPCPVRRVMRDLGYPPVNVDAALSWISHRGRIDGCPVVDVADWRAVNAAARKLPDPPTFDAPSPRQAGYEPSPDDARWNAQTSPLRHDGFFVSGLASRGEWVSRLGLIPSAVAEHVRRTESR